MDNLYVGQKLKTLTNEFVTIVGFEQNDIIVSYKNKTYKRSKNVIGEKLFICKSKDEFFSEIYTDKPTHYPRYGSDIKLDNHGIPHKPEKTPNGSITESRLKFKKRDF